MVLALLAERASGVPFHDLVDERVCRPASMTENAFRRSGDGGPRRPRLPRRRRLAHERPRPAGAGKRRRRDRYHRNRCPRCRGTPCSPGGSSRSRPSGEMMRRRGTRRAGALDAANGLGFGLDDLAMGTAVRCAVAMPASGSSPWPTHHANDDSPSPCCATRRDQGGMAGQPTPQPTAGGVALIYEFTSTAPASRRTSRRTSTTVPASRLVGRQPDAGVPRSRVGGRHYRRSRSRSRYLPRRSHVGELDPAADAVQAQARVYLGERLDAALPPDSARATTDQCGRPTTSPRSSYSPVVGEHRRCVRLEARPRVSHAPSSGDRYGDQWWARWPTRRWR